VYYQNLYRWEKAFVACAVVFADTDECAEGATVTVELDGAVVGEGTCDNFGEVTIDRLEPGREYAVRVAATGYAAATLAVTLDKSTTLGTLFLERD
jgi:hypothetical protein